MSEPTIEPGGVEVHHVSGPSTDEVPDKANDVKTWINDTDDAAERTRRADLAEQAEGARADGPRTSVTDAIAAARAI